jgi:S1-C subfamily serine protease
MNTGMDRGSGRLLAGLGILALLLVALAGIGGGLVVAAPLAGKLLGETRAIVQPLLGRPVTAASGDAAQPAANIGDAMAIVAAEEQVLGDIYTRVLPSVVHLQVTQKATAGGSPDLQFQMPNIPGLPNPFGAPNDQGGSPFGSPNPGQSVPGLPFEPDAVRGEGSGFVWDAEGHIVTNAHVVDNAEAVIVIFPDGLEVEGKVLGSDPSADLAVVQVTGVPANKLVPVALGDSDAVKVGQLAVAIGNPFGLANTMTTGIVSAVGRTIHGLNAFSIPEVIQTDAPINPGNSGGPLLDRKGQVIGINSQIISRSGANAGVGFAVPINIAKQVVPALVKDGDYEYAWLGIQGQSLGMETVEAMQLPEGTKGALVIAATQGGPAAAAGLKGSEGAMATDGSQIPTGGDVIVGIDGRPVEDMDDLISYLNGETRPGDIIKLDLIRAGGEHDTVSVTLGERPDALEMGQAQPQQGGR